MEIEQLGAAADKGFKTLIDLNWNFRLFKKDIPYRFLNQTHRKNDFYEYTRNTIKIGNKMLRSLGADIYNSLFENIK